MSRPFAKILVVYHKKAPLCKSDVLVPIHAGRAIACKKSKDGVVSNKELQWLTNNMIGDNTGDNISISNRFINEMTALYWAWKNYDQLGNPEYIGLYHYRRFLLLTKDFCSKDIKHINSFYTQDTLRSILSQNDFIAADSLENETTVAKWAHHNTPGVNLKNLQICLDYVKQDNPQIGKVMEEFLNSPGNHLCNMFIMKKEHFFAYCEWIFPVISFCMKNIQLDKNATHPNAERIVGYLAELLTATYITHMETRKLKYRYYPICSVQKERFSIINKRKYMNGRRIIYFCGLPVFVYKKKHKIFPGYPNSCCDIKYYDEYVSRGIHFPHLFGIVIARPSTIGDNCWIYQNVTIGAKTNKAGDGKTKENYPEIGENTIIYAGAVVVGGIKIGRNCVIGANSVVINDIPDNSIAAGNPAKVVKTIK